jgi:hypothetical protein
LAHGSKQRASTDAERVALWKSASQKDLRRMSQDANFNVKIKSQALVGLARVGIQRMNQSRLVIVHYR